MSSLGEIDVEDWVINLLKKQGYTYLSLQEQEAERGSFSKLVLHRYLKDAIDTFNPSIPEEARAQALREVLNVPGQNLVESNESFHQMLTQGVSVEYQKNGHTVGDTVWLINFEQPLDNSFLVCNQFTVIENKINKRPDIVICINGLPLVVMELKNPTDVSATMEKAFEQLRTYKKSIPSLFCYNGFLVISDGCDAKVGSLTSEITRFTAWQIPRERTAASSTQPQMTTLVKGLFCPQVLLDMLRHFTVFEKIKREDPETQLTNLESIKKIAAYHQYYAVKEAIKSTVRATHQEPLQIGESPVDYGLPSVENQPKGDRKAGVVWHTQGSGKSLSMVFYVGLLVVNEAMKNPTIIVITDRNDLDNQLFDAFVAGKSLLRQAPKQAQSRAELKQLLQTAGGGIVFSTIQKFLPEAGSEHFERLSERTNIVVIADEAHRSQYGFQARTLVDATGARTRYGFAKYIRDALPNASFIGFTGTPIETQDTSTPAVFGNYIDIYDIEQAVHDGATVPIFYESRLVDVHLLEEEREQLDAKIEAITETEEGDATVKAKYAKWEAIIGHRERIKKVVADILSHLEARREVREGKAMIVATSRRIAVAMYDEVIALCPSWHQEDKRKGIIKVVMTSSSSDPAEWQQHSTTKQERRELGERFKDPADPLQVVIVRDMWLTGFDAPCLDTLYCDKVMRGHNLMQAIARVNRIYKDKSGGLVVDYIGIASDLRQGLDSYTKNGGRGAPALEQEKAVETMLELYDVISCMFGQFKYMGYFTADTEKKLTLILDAEEYILGLPKGKERFTKGVTNLSKAFALSVPHPKAMRIKGEVGFFQAVKARLLKLKPLEGGSYNVDVETAIKQILDKAIVVGEVIDIFDAAGIRKPDLSILSDEFLTEVRGMKRKNLARELLEKILADEIKTRERKNLTQSKRFSELLEEAINKYRNHLLTATEIIDALILLAKEMQASDEKASSMGLSSDEIAFYEALADNQSAKEVMGDKKLRKLASVLVEKVKNNTTLDWMIKEDARAKLRGIVKRTLRQHGYPPDKAQLAIEIILKQTELFASEVYEE